MAVLLSWVNESLGCSFSLDFLAYFFCTNLTNNHFSNYSHSYSLTHFANNTNTNRSTHRTNNTNTNTLTNDFNTH